MKTTLQARPDRLLFFLAIWSTLYLTRAYLGGTFAVLFNLYNILLIINCAHLLWAASQLHYSQKFSIFSPLRGESVDYTVNLMNQSLVPGCRTSLVIGGIDSSSLMDSTNTIGFDLYPDHDRNFSRSFAIHCPYRGLHKAGITSLQLTDILSFLTIRIPVWQENLLVYPRVHELSSCNLRLHSAGYCAYQNNSGETDYSLFNSMQDYHPGESARHIDWKYFAATRNMRVPEFGTSTMPVLNLYFDRNGRDADAVLERESQDTAMEVVLALANYFVSQNTLVRIRFEDGLESYGSAQEEQAVLQRRCALFTFAKYAHRQTDPATELAEDIKHGDSGNAQAVGVFRAFDASTLAFLEFHSSEHHASYALVIGSGLQPKELTQLEIYRARLETPDRLILVKNADCIVEALQCR